MNHRSDRVSPRWIVGFALALAVTAVACSAGEAVPAESGDEGVKLMARVGDTEISKADLEEVLAGDLERLDKEYKKNRHELLEQGLDNMIVEKLLETEAASREMTVDDLFKVEVEDKITEVTDEEVDAFYEARKAQIPQPKEEVADRIRDFLRSQQAQPLQQELLESLREKYEVTSYLEPIRVEVAAADGPSKGPADAPVTVVEFSDFQCPFCSRVVPTLDRVAEEYGDKVRIVFRQFPLRGIHPEAQKAAEASLCADDQGKFWEMHDAMFADQGGLSLDELKTKAGELELEMESFNDCLDSDKYAERVESDLQDGMAAGVSGTPALFINGRFLSGAQPFEEIARIIDNELNRSAD